MATTFRTRLIQVNQVVYDQVDIFQANFFDRVTGLTPTDVTLGLTLNNQAVNWPLVDGTGVIDSQVVAGSIYWAELTSGAYGIRFFPNSLGHWNLTISYAPVPQIVLIDYDVMNPAVAGDTGLRVDFCT
jgi:hypothetical protein